MPKQSYLGWYNQYMSRELEFLYEIGALRNMPRQWQRFHMANVANNSEHMFRVVWIALVLASKQDKRLDTEKIMKMALAHDVAESRTGDVDYLARQYVTRDETKALADIFHDTSLKNEFAALLEEYEKRESLEAKIVKDADNLDVDLELQEQISTGMKLPEDWREFRKIVADTKLYTQAAKDMHEAIWQSNPHDWHVKSHANRINGGDWKK